MLPPDPNEDRIVRWMRKHPKLAIVLACLVIGLIPASIGLREWSQASDGTSDIKSSLIKGAALVAGALIIAWRANKRMRNH
jgi:hypothetical protein